MAVENPRQGAPFPDRSKRIPATTFFYLLTKANWNELDFVNNKKHGDGYGMDFKGKKVSYFFIEDTGSKEKPNLIEKPYPTILLQEEVKKRWRTKRRKVVVEEVDDIVPIGGSIVVIGMTKNRGVALTIRADGTYDYEQTKLQSH